MWDSVIVRQVNLRSEREVGTIRQFLDRFALRFDTGVDYTIALLKNDTVVATGSLAGEVLRNFAVDESLQGEGLIATVVTELMREAAARGVFHYFIYTRPQKADLFASLGFAEIARVEPYAAVLEAGLGSIQQYCQSIIRQTIDLPQQNRAALIMNCNPFTKGHFALIKEAASRHNIIVFIVSEDRSLFPYVDRLRLVQEGVADLANVAVVPGGKYIISAATFPSYFTRESETMVAQTRLDVTLFASRIASALGIQARYVGEEPYCEVTAAYNAAMAEVLPAYDISLHVLPRVSVNGEIVSASKVRELIRRDEWAQVRQLVPETTFGYLASEAAQPIIANIKNSQARH